MIRTFKFTFTCEVYLSEEQIWPDGAPENITAQDAADVVEEEGGVLEVLREWSIDDNMQLDIIADDGTTARVVV